MAEKYSMLIKYKYFDYVKNANLDDGEAWLLFKGIIEYDKTGNIPTYENKILTGLFAAIKCDLDENRVKWEETVKSKSEAGKIGMEKRWNGKKNNITKITDDNTDNKNNSNNRCYQDITDITQITKITDSDLDSGYVNDLDSVSEPSSQEIKDIKSSGGYKPPLLLKIKNDLEKMGFFVDDAIIKSFVNAIKDQTWLTGQFSFLDYCSEKVRIKYPDKNNDELKPIFISAVKKWQDMRNSYPQWKAEHEEESEKIKNKNMPPTHCKCGNKLTKNYDKKMVCHNCRVFISFDEKNNKWVYEE